jgi:hypothetical protein
MADTGMTKLIDPAGWDFDRPIMVSVKISSRGLIGNDRNDFIKVAGHVFLDAIDNLKVAEDEIPVHMVAMGSTEYFGANRNGDGWKEAMLRRCHPTFVKYAKPFRDHKNDADKDPYFGVVKLSAYNDDMHRVELFEVLNATEKAAARNGGQVADREIAKLDKQGEYGVSMAARVPCDCCSSCGNIAPTRKQYCDEHTCIGPHGEKRGGCKKNLTKVSADGHVLHVDNPEGTFFDISHVGRPADREAYAVRAGYMNKAASDEIISSAELAEALGVTTPPGVLASIASEGFFHLPEHVIGQQKLAYALADLEIADGVDGAAALSLSPRVRAKFATDQLTGYADRAAVTNALAGEGVIMPLEAFALWTNKSAELESARRQLPELFTQLIGTQGYVLAEANPFFPVRDVKVATAVAAKSAADWSLLLPAVLERSMLATLRGVTSPELQATVKIAAASRGLCALARDYALYQLASLYKIAADGHDLNLTARLCVRQNKI